MYLNINVIYKLYYIMASEAVAVASGAVTSEIQQKNKLVFFPSGRLGNALFRYMACALVNIINPELEYTLLADCVPLLHDTKEKFKYYPGLDYEGNDLYKSAHSTMIEIEKEAANNNKIMGYNTLGYFKHTIDLGNLTSNIYINKSNGQGLYVKKSISLTDDNFFSMFYKKLEYFNVCMDGFFQFGYIYLKYKQQILDYMEQHKHTHSIQTDINERFLMRDILDDIVLPENKKYDIVIHIRLGDFNGRPDFIELDHYIALFDSLYDVFVEYTIKNGIKNGKRIGIVYQPTTSADDGNYIAACQQWFINHAIPFHFEYNSILVDFNIMKQAKMLICSMSTLSWTAAYFSNHIERCYMPNYNFFTNTDRASFFFHKPIQNTILYTVKSTPTITKSLAKIKPYILTLPEYGGRLAKLDNLNLQLSQIGLDTLIYNGVHGKEITVYDAAYKHTGIKHITWKGTTYAYDTRTRLNGIQMTRGEFGCAWSHLNLLQQLVKDDYATEYYLILEDDVELVKPLSQLYELLNHIPADTDICHLAKSDWYPFIKTQQINAYFYKCEKQFFNKTTAYIISKKGAQKVLDYTKNSINVPIDDLFNMIYRLTDHFNYYVPESFYFKEQDNIESTIIDINK